MRWRRPLKTAGALIGINQCIFLTENKADGRGVIATVDTLISNRFQEDANDVCRIARGGGADIRKEVQRERIKSLRSEMGL